MTEADIAAMTEQPANKLRRMAMVHDEIILTTS